MPILDEKTIASLHERLSGRLPGPVELRLYRRPDTGRLALPPGVGCRTCAAAEELAGALVEAASGIISLEVIDVSATPDSPVRDVPTLTVGTPGSEHRIRFQGLPIGYEFAVLLDAVERVSSSDPGLRPEHVEQLSTLPQVTELLVFVTPNCSYCPAASAMANRMALADSNFRSIVVEANEFPELSDQFGVQGVPQTVVNRSAIFVGALPPAAFVERVLQLVGGDRERASPN
ncbi:MAG TPA: hypothetical protein DEV93_01625 [Chloroflexi bacterium]|jgi:glutaredoxin-like protein|nr:hypothetical protein [Chloroflexota bacterium]